MHNCGKAGWEIWVKSIANHDKGHAQLGYIPRIWLKTFQWITVCWGMLWVQVLTWDVVLEWPRVLPQYHQLILIVAKQLAILDISFLQMKDCCTVYIYCSPRLPLQYCLYQPPPRTINLTCLAGHLTCTVFHLHFAIAVYIDFSSITVPEQWDIYRILLEFLGVTIWLLKDHAQSTS